MIRMCKNCHTADRYRDGHCKVCAKTRALAMYHRNPELHLKRAAEWKRTNRGRSRQLGRKGGRTDWKPGEHEKAEARLLTVSVCEVCRSPDAHHKRGWNADHDHATGLFRGIVCHPCNIAISHVEKFGLDRGQQIASYLLKSKATHED